MFVLHAADLTSQPAEFFCKVSLNCCTTRTTNTVCDDVPSRSQTLVVLLRVKVWARHDPVYTNTEGRTRVRTQTWLSQQLVVMICSLSFWNTDRQKVCGWLTISSSRNNVLTTLNNVKLEYMHCSVYVRVCVLTTLISWARDTWMYMVTCWLLLTAGLISLL